MELKKSRYVPSTRIGTSTQVSVIMWTKYLVVIEPNHGMKVVHLKTHPRHPTKKKVRIVVSVEVVNEYIEIVID